MNDPSPFFNFILAHFADYIYFIVEFGIAFSVLFLGCVIFFNKRLPIIISSIIILSFGITHGAAHGISIPYVIQPYLFVLGFCSGTIVLHIFGVLIGYFSIKKPSVNQMTRYTGLLISAFGIKLTLNLF
jgi:urease accessory protein